MVLSLWVALLALVVITPPGIALALVQARRHYRLKTLVEFLVLLPMILPPTVVGFFLVFLLGRKGALGQLLESGLGLRLIFTPGAAVVASCVVSFPIVVRTAQAAFEAVPVELEEVGRSMGLGPLKTFFRVTLPMAWRGVVAALVLAFARAIAEFGATLMFAGNIPGRTNTMPLEIFAAYQAGDDARALSYVLVMTGIAVAVVLVTSRLGRRRAA
ncbi:MAG: molybdate ABC transporter permease subunit [Myxococcota bacterium]